MSLPKTIWFANQYAVSFCGAMSGRPLRRRLHSNGTAKWATFYDAETLRKIWSCNATFAAAHFYKQRK